MASFTDALQALAQGRLKADVLLTHMADTLSRRPELLDAVLAQLAEAYASGLIAASTSAKLRAHALQAAESANSKDTVYAPTQPQHVATVALMDTSAMAGDNPVSDSTDLTGDVSNIRVEVGELDLDLTAAVGAAADAEDAVLLGTVTLAAQPIAVGAMIKERFVLDEIIGVGGMGTVYKGRDLLKVEACDKNPYVALKVLNEDFKKHPDAFIALQREASRQQRLAHPNIATVYDFDRSGNTVFLTMEFLEGQPLNTYMRKQVRPRGGLPFAQAYPIIRGLGLALSYAHERDIVHSDFKPANCFITTSGTVKVLDFGIARAIKGQDDGEKSVFDPSRLGALTPAYASPEMLTGEDPDPRDDVYALACLAYELLSGQHPFDRKSATHAREKKMTPAPIRGLTRAQMRALTRALSLIRAKRTSSVNAFLEELKGARSRIRPVWWIVAVATVLALALGALVALRNHSATVPAVPPTETPSP